VRCCYDQQSLSELSVCEYSVNMSNVAARQRLNIAMPQDDDQVDHWSNLGRRSRGPDTVCRLFPSTGRQGVNGAPHRNKVFPAFDRTMSASHGATDRVQKGRSPNPPNTWINPALLTACIIPRIELQSKARCEYSIFRDVSCIRVHVPGSSVRLLRGLPHQSQRKLSGTGTALGEGSEGPRS
jgi:hypothetical protein